MPFAGRIGGAAELASNRPTSSAQTPAAFTKQRARTVISRPVCSSETNAADDRPAASIEAVDARVVHDHGAEAVSGP